MTANSIELDTWSAGEGACARRVGPGVLIFAETDESALTQSMIETLLDRLPVEPGRVPVVVNMPLRSRPEALADLVASAIGPILSARVVGIRLILSGAGISAPDSPARLIASRIGVDVVAADGPILLVGGEQLFVAASDVEGGWRCFRPDGSTAPSVALRCPAPPWERDVPVGVSSLRSGLLVEPIPAGLWLHRPRPDHGVASDPVFGIAARDDQILLVSGGPDGAAPDQESVREALGLLDPLWRDLVHVVGYERTGQVARASSVAVDRPAPLAATSGPPPVAAPTAQRYGAVPPRPSRPSLAEEADGALRRPAETAAPGLEQPWPRVPVGGQAANPRPTSTGVPAVPPKLGETPGGAPLDDDVLVAGLGSVAVGFPSDRVPARRRGSDLAPTAGAVTGPALAAQASRIGRMGAAERLLGSE